MAVEGIVRAGRLFKYILITSAISGMCSVLEAGQDVFSEPEVELKKVVVTNRRTPTSLEEATENITVVGKDEIDSLPARNLSEVLSYIEGVNIQPRQGFGRATSVSVQGADSRQVRVMIDGIPLNTQSSGQTNPVEFPVENIERIEVIKGAASSVWGSALGGVVNIITKDTGVTSVPKGSATTSVAEFHTRKESLQINGKADDAGYYVLSSHLQSGGEGWRDDTLEKKSFSKLSYDLKDSGRLIASFGYSDAGVNSGVFPDATWQAQPYKDRYGSISWNTTFSSNDIKIELKHFRKDLITRYYASQIEEEPYLEIKNKDILYQLSLNSSSRFRDTDLLVIGADLDYDTVKSPSYISKAKTINLYAPCANYTLKIKPLTFNFGLRYDYNSEFGKETSPSIGAVYHFKAQPNTLLRFAISRAFNAPPLLWKFNQSDALATAANPDIGPERAWVYETGFESRVLDVLWLKASLYSQDVSDALATAINGSGYAYKKNFKKYRRQGAGLESRLKIFEGLTLTGAAFFNDIEDRETKQTVRGGGKPRQGFDTGLEYKNNSGLGILLSGYYDRWNEPADSQPNDRKMLFDLKVSQGYNNLTVFLNIYNLTNTGYWADYFFPVPERYFESGISINW